MGRSRTQAARASRSSFVATVQDGILRTVDDDEPRTSVQCAPHLVPIESKRRRRQCDAHAASAREPHRRLIRIVGGVEDNDLVPGSRNGLYRVVQSFGGAAGNGDLVGADQTAADSRH